jgi:hypothetical protein
MANRKPRRGASPGIGRRVKPSRQNATRADGEMIARAELAMMREIIVVLVQAITDLFACLPRHTYATEKITRIEQTLAKVHRALAERRQRWATEDDRAQLN